MGGSISMPPLRSPSRHRINSCNITYDTYENKATLMLCNKPNIIERFQVHLNSLNGNNDETKTSFEIFCKLNHLNKMIRSDMSLRDSDIIANLLCTVRSRLLQADLGDEFLFLVKSYNDLGSQANLNKNIKENIVTSDDLVVLIEDSKLALASRFSLEFDRCFFVERNAKQDVIFIGPSHREEVPSLEFANSIRLDDSILANAYSVEQICRSDAMIVLLNDYEQDVSFLWPHHGLEEGDCSSNSILDILCQLRNEFLKIPVIGIVEEDDVNGKVVLGALGVDLIIYAPDQPSKRLIDLLKVYKENAVTLECLAMSTDVDSESSMIRPV